MLAFINISYCYCVCMSATFFAYIMHSLIVWHYYPTRMHKGVKQSVCPSVVVVIGTKTA